MNRRNFMMLRADSGRAVELSCQRLYLWYLDTQITRGQQPATSGPEDREPWDGEPAACFEERTVAALFGDLERELLDVRILRIRQREWLIHEEMAREFETLLAAFRKRGGRVEFIE